MPTRPLTYLGNPVLRATATPIADPQAPDIAALARDMVETMAASNGVGLAAPQVGRASRLIVFHVPAQCAEESVPLHILLNPAFTPLSEETELGMEGCLSIPGLRGLVPRYSRILYSGVDLAGNPVEQEAAGFHARVVQHEIDHLNGVMYLDRMPDFTSLTHESVIRRQLQQQAEEANAQA